MTQQNIPKGFVSPHKLAGSDTSASILIGFSGGADSSALLYMLSEYTKSAGCKLYAAHINHGIRGAEADRDEEFCKKTAEKLGIRFFVLHADVPSIAKESGESVETAARRVRYGFFEKLMKEHSIPILATAHNANDNLETTVFNLARGTGLDGLCGIPRARDVNGGMLVRPILDMSRAEILDFCAKNCISYVTDSTNTDTDYSRNKIRADIIPSLISINGSAVSNATRASENLRADSQYLWQLTDDFLKKNLKDKKIELDALKSAPQPIFNRAIMRIYSDMTDGASLDADHIESVRRLVSKATAHSYIDLPHAVEAAIENGLVFRKKTDKVRCEPYEFELNQENTTISQTNCEIVIGNSQKKINIYKTSILLYIDSVKIKGVLKARDRRAGDRILENGMHKSVKKLMCEKKIPQELRPRIPMICDDTGIVAIPFIGVRDGYAPKDGCDTAISIKFDPK